MNETNERLDTAKDLMLFLEQRDTIQHEHSIRDQELGRMLNEEVGFDAKDCMLFLIKKKRLDDAETELRDALKKPRDAAESERRGARQRK